MQNSAVQGVQLPAVSTAHRLPVGAVADSCRPGTSRKKELSWQAVYYHFQKWSADGSLQRVWEQSVEMVREDLNLTQLNLDGSHTIAKKGGESVAYQHRKRAKTSNILP